MSRLKDLIEYSFIRALTFPFSFLPLKTIHFIGEKIGLIAFYLLSNYRKRALSNLSLASSLNLSNEEMITVAKQSFQNLAINCLEYAKFSQKKDLQKLIICENPTLADQLYKEGKGIIFFCGHQSNWEVLFLDGTKRMRGIAIGKPIKNKKLYAWIVSIREKNGGRIIQQRHAVKEGLKNLKKGVFMGIVGDQGMPTGQRVSFLGRKAYTSTAPALLAYKTKNPIIVATTRREKGCYKIHYSDPIWPNLDKPLEREVFRMTTLSSKLLEESIKKSPGQWLWQHNRWKTQTPKNVYKPYRQDALCILLSEENFSLFFSLLPTFKTIYPEEILHVFAPEKYREKPFPKNIPVEFYQTPKDLFQTDYRFKLIFNFTSCEKLKKHFKKLSAFSVLSFEDLKNKAVKKTSPKEIVLSALCREGTLWQ